MSRLTFTYSLKGCTNSTDAGLASLAAGCGTLTAVVISCCTNITDVELASLAAGCRDYFLLA